MSYHITQEQKDAVDELAQIFRLRSDFTKPWNKRLKKGELKIMGGWCWQSWDKKREGRGMQSPTQAYIDAYEELILGGKLTMLAKAERVAKRDHLKLVKAA